MLKRWLTNLAEATAVRRAKQRIEARWHRGLFMSKKDMADGHIIATAAIKSLRHKCMAAVCHS